MASSTLQEFVIRLGFKANEQQLRNFRESLEKIGKNALDLTKSFVQLGEASIAAGTIMGGALAVAAKQMEGLYFAAQRTGASPTELESFSSAVQDIGLNADQATSAVEALANARRVSPGLDTALAGLHVDPRETDDAKVLLRLLDQLHDKPAYQQAGYAQLFGLDPQTVMQMERNLPELQKALALREKLFGLGGVTPEQGANASHEFMNQLRLLGQAFLWLTEIIAVRFMPWADRFFAFAAKTVDYFLHLDKETDGWSSKLLGLAAAIVTLSTALGTLLNLSGIGKLFAFGGRLIGIGGGAAAAGAGETAVAGGATSVLPFILPILGVIIAAVAFAMGIKYLDNKYGSGIRAGLGLTDDVGENQKRIKSGVTSLTGAFEGFSKKVYRDVAGHLTVGYGHLVKAGEDFSGGLDRDSAAALLARDMRSAVDAVHALVKVHLGKNQESALDDLVFNIGKSAFSKSKLLKYLNAGDFADASGQFAAWNKITQNGHHIVNQGLVNRRAAEAKLFNTPDKSVVVNVKSDYHIEGGDPKANGREVASHQGRVNADLVRNLSVAVQ